MKLNKNIYACLVIALGLFSVNSVAENICKGYGPQTPRDINNLTGENKAAFSIAPSHEVMNLCNIHFHSSGTQSDGLLNLCRRW